MATKKKAAQAAAVSPPPSYEEGDIRRYLDNEAAVAFSAKEWAGKIVLTQLLSYAQKLGRPMSREDIGQWVAAQEERRDREKTLKDELRTLLDERPDPDAAPQPCGAARHLGANPVIKPGSRFLLTKGADGHLVRRRHEGGGEEIRGGDFLVTPDEEEAVFYCRSCREAADRDAQRGGYRLTWYASAAGGKKLAAIAAAAKRHEKALAVEKAAGRRFYPVTPRGQRRQQ